MKEKIQRILPSYIGCDMILNKDQDIPQKFTFGIFWLIRTAEFLGGKKGIAVDYPKLILRTADELTEKEDDAVRKIYDKKTTFRSVSEVKRVRDNAKEINYLRSIGVDCDGLIKKGIAISKKQYDKQIKKASKGKKA